MRHAHSLLHRVGSCMWLRDSLVVAPGLSCSTVCGIFVPQPGIGALINRAPRFPPTLSPTAPPAARGQVYSRRRAQTSQRRGPTPVSGRQEDPVSAALAPSPPTGPGAPVPSLSIPGNLHAPGPPNPPFSGFPNISPLAPPGQPHSTPLPRRD